MCELTPEIIRTLMPDPPPRRSCTYQYSWRLVAEGRTIARSADYFDTEEGAVAAWEEFCEAAEFAPIEHEPASPPVPQDENPDQEAPGA